MRIRKFAAFFRWLFLLSFFGLGLFLFQNYAPFLATPSHGGCVNIVDFGADPTGKSASDQPVALAISKAKKISGKKMCLVFPAGEFRLQNSISITLPSNDYTLTVSGAGTEVTSLVWPASVNGFEVQMNSALNSIHFWNMTLATAQSGRGTALSFQQSATAKPPLNIKNEIGNIELRGYDHYAEGSHFWLTGMQMTAVSNITYSNVMIVGSSLPGGNPSSRGVVIDGTPSLTSIGHHFYNCNFIAVGQGLVLGQAHGNIQGVEIANSNFSSVTRGIIVPAHISNVSEVRIVNSQFAYIINAIGVYSSIQQLSIATSLFDMTSLGNPKAPAFQAASITFSGLTNNSSFIISSSGFQGLNYATLADFPNSMAISITNSPKVKGQIVGNSFLDFSGPAIQIGSDSSGVAVDSNTYSCINSRTLTDCAPVTASVIRNLGGGNFLGGASKVLIPPITGANDLANSNSYGFEAVNAKGAGPSNCVNVKTLGAKPGRKFDNTSIFQSALQSAAVSGGCVYIPAGTYMLNAQLRAALNPPAKIGNTPTQGVSLAIVGDGPKQTFLHWMASAPTSGISLSLNSISQTSVHIWNLALITDQAGSGPALSVAQLVENDSGSFPGPSEFGNLDIRGDHSVNLAAYWSKAISVLSASNFNYVNLHVEGATSSPNVMNGHGVDIDGVLGFTVEHNFDNCIFENLSNAIQYGIKAGQLRGLTVLNSEFKDVNYGITSPKGAADLAQMAIFGSTFSYFNAGIATWAPIHFNQIANNQFQDLAPIANAVGIGLFDSLASLVVNNTFSVQNPKAGAGIYIAKTSNREGNVITNNHFLGFSNPAVAIYLPSDSSMINVKSNTPAAEASAAGDVKSSEKGSL